MILCDVNVLIYAFRADAAGHAEYRAWLQRRVAGDEAYGVSELILSAFVRITTHPKVFAKPSTLAEAFGFAEAIRARPHAILVAPGPRHWDIFRRLCETGAARGNLIPDAYFAALAIESGCEWMTTDRDYSRFPGLRFGHPLDAPK